MKVVIVDYGMGNIKSISSVVRFLGVNEVAVSNQREKILSADKLILPGVGSYAKAMRNIKEFKIDVYLEQAVLKDKKPILGICLGMQLMCNYSEEDGGSEGLNFVPGKVSRLSAEKIKVPHVGFNQIRIDKEMRLYKEMGDMCDFYFTHSFKLCSDAEINQVYCDYGEMFIASYEVANIAGAQFHPELSQTNGLKFISNFLKAF